MAAHRRCSSDAGTGRRAEEPKLRLKPDAGVVSYASSCTFRGYKVPHLVVQTASGPVTVMVLVHEAVRHATQFDEQGYRGTIVPVPGMEASPCSCAIPT